MSFPVNSENKVKFSIKPAVSSKPASTAVLKVAGSSKAVVAVRKKKKSVESVEVAVLAPLKELNIQSPKKAASSLPVLKNVVSPLKEIQPKPLISDVVTIENPLAGRARKKIDKEFYSMLMSIVEGKGDELDMPRVYLDMPDDTYNGYQRRVPMNLTPTISRSDDKGSRD